MQTPLQDMQPLLACECTEQYQYSACDFCHNIYCIHKNADSCVKLGKENHFKVFALRKLSVITRSPAISAFILCGQLVSRTSNKVKEPIPSKPFVNPFILWTKALLWKRMQITHCISNSSQKTQKRLHQNEPRLWVPCRVKVVFRTPFLWIQEKRQNRTSIFFFF